MKTLKTILALEIVKAFLLSDLDYEESEIEDASEDDMYFQYLISGGKIEIAGYSTTGSYKDSDGEFHHYVFKIRTNDYVEIVFREKTENQGEFYSEKKVVARTKTITYYE